MRRYNRSIRSGQQTITLQQCIRRVHWGQEHTWNTPAVLGYQISLTCFIGENKSVTKCFQWRPWETRKCSRTNMKELRAAPALAWSTAPCDVKVSGWSFILLNCCSRLICVTCHWRTVSGDTGHTRRAYTRANPSLILSNAVKTEDKDYILYICCPEYKKRRSCPIL